MIPTTHYLVVAAALLVVGALGMLVRRNIVVLLMSLELMLNAVNLNLVAFSRHHGHTDGQAVALFIVAVAVAEAAVGLGLLLALFRHRQTVQADEVDLLKW